MKSLLLLVAIAFALPGQGQGLSRFEIWGISDQTKAAFVEQYRQATGKDLNYTYACAADLEKMGYQHSYSQIWVEEKDMDKFFAGKLNWDSTERLVIVRAIPDNPYNRAPVDEANQNALRGVLSEWLSKDTASVERYLGQNPETLPRLLIGLNSRNSEFRKKCKKLLSLIQPPYLPETPDNQQLLGSLLSFPDFETCYLAMRIIEHANWTYDANPQLFAAGAVTLDDFLHSDLKNFRTDAMSFLTGRLEPGHDAGKTHLSWSAWIASQQQAAD